MDQTPAIGLDIRFELMKKGYSQIKQQFMTIVGKRIC